MAYRRKLPAKLTGREVFKNTGKSEFSVLEYWRYAYSNLNSNILRGSLAEFLVEKALSGRRSVGIRDPWADYDVLAPTGIKVEVKCCSYLQDWDQPKLSRVVFTGLKARRLYFSPGDIGDDRDKNSADYKADVYVLALLKHQNPNTLDILDLNQWCFYVLPRAAIAKITRNGSSVSLCLLEKNGHNPVSYRALKKAIMSATANH